MRGSINSPQADVGDTVLKPPDPPQSFKTLVELLRWRAERQPNRVAYRFLDDGETAPSELTYQQLDHRARMIAAYLQSLAHGGERVLALYPPGLEYIAAFFGCLYAGVVAVPAYPPRHNRRALRLRTLALDAQAGVALTTAKNQEAVESVFGGAHDVSIHHVIDTTKLPEALASEWREPELNEETLAFLQYTSGSTGDPHGVVLTHANLLCNSEVLSHAFEYDANSHCVSWLPMFHDMGLIGSILQPLYGGYGCTLMAPETFLQSPIKWLKAISRTRANISGGPNFAYDLCALRTTPEQREGLDLRCWEVAFNGSEMVRHSTLERFSETFAPYGFNSRAFFPCYGLAEATLIVTGGPKGHGPVTQTVDARSLERRQIIQSEQSDGNRQTLVSSGRGLPGQHVRIVDPDTATLCPAGKIGEIWVSGPSVAQGYWRNASATEQVFRAYIADTGEGPFLRTGDLGLLSDDQLFVMGRLKHLIIIRGLNYYPQDIEQTVERCHTTFPPYAGAAFSVDIDGEERLIVAQEVRRYRDLDVTGLFADVRRAVIEEHGLEPYEIVFVRYGGIPKTSSGKIQRLSCRRDYLDGTLSVIATWRDDARSVDTAAAPSAGVRPRDPEAIERWLRDALSASFGRDFSGHAAPEQIDWAGLDSLKAVDLIHRMETGLGVSLSLSEIMRGVTLDELARKAFAQLTRTTPGESDEARPENLPSNAEAEAHPLSYGQRALWFLSQLPCDLTPDNIHIAARSRRPLDISALRRCFQKLALRHPVLSAAYRVAHGSPAQYTLASFEVPLQEVEAADWEPDTLQRELKTEAHRRFDLEREPLFRMRIFRLGPEEHLILLVIHHSIADMWSLAIIARELGLLYRAETGGESAALAEPSWRYTDFVRWQEEFVASQRGEEQWRYWRERLEGESPMLNLPTDRPRPLVQTFPGAMERIVIPPDLTAALKAFSAANDASLFVTLLAAFHVLLHRYTWQEDLIVGAPVAGRTSAKWADVAGYFVNMLPIRAVFSSNVSFNEFHRQIRETTLAAIDHQDYPFNLLVERLNPRRDPGRTPIFQAMFVFQNVQLDDHSELPLFALGADGARVELGGLHLESVFVERCATRFDLSLAMADGPNGLVGAIEYNTDIFDRTTIERLCGHWRNLLSAVAAHPEQSLHSLPILFPSEVEQLIISWNQTTQSIPPVKFVHQQFLLQAARQPDAIALICGSERITYGELRRRAAHVAMLLRARGLKPEERVGVLMRRGEWMLGALIGVMMAGGAYVALDIEYPAERVEYMMMDAGVRVLLVDEGEGSKWGEVIGVEAVELGGEAGEEVVERAEEGVESEQLAYVLYTSGSTGRPKGVAIEHRSAVAFLHWALTQYTPQQLARTLFSTSICFDLSVFEIFAPLSCGATIIMAENALQLPQLPAANEVTLINTVPSAMAELARMGAVPASALTVNLAGEALQGSLVERIYQSTAAQKVFNLYGPTEATTYATCEETPCDLVGNPSIGRPIANTQIYILNEALQPVPVGVVGDLYIGGAGLARGYLNQPALTAERFTPNPFGSQNGDRMYRTGDLARFLPDGRIEYLGRSDQQVKIRGFRIELGEIEAVLLTSPFVMSAVVAPRESHDGQKNLVAYMIAADGERPSVAQLREYLRTKLPEHMTPNQYVWLTEMPLTPNGKINRRALPEPQWSRAQLTEHYLAPRTPTETVLADIWRQVLKVERVGVDDDFFELGGHSLLATQIASRVTESLRVELPLSVLFESPTIARLAEIVERLQGLGAESRFSEIKPVARASRRVRLPQ
jgi:amino acid adenylation domain-containing protein